VLIFMSALVMSVLAITLWKRLTGVDPLVRCAAAYESSYTAVDTSLVDRIKVNKPNTKIRTTCRELRLNGAINSVPRDKLRAKRPRPGAGQ
jgi:hypothetical protein